MNLDAAELIVTNVAFTLKSFGSAMDYKRLNDKDFLTPGIKVATKMMVHRSFSLLGKCFTPS